MSEEKRKDAEIKRLETELDMVQTAWQELKEENVRLLQQCLSLYRAVKAANCNLDAIEEKCDNNVWFQKIKERTY
jgi:uncharacterized protein YfbU (UPF0304 family)